VCTSLIYYVLEEAACSTASQLDTLALGHFGTALKICAVVRSGSVIACLGNEEAVGGTARKVADVLRLQYPAQPPLGPVLIAELNRRFVAISVNLPCSTQRLQSLQSRTWNFECRVKTGGGLAMSTRVAWIQPGDGFLASASLTEHPDSRPNDLTQP